MQPDQDTALWDAHVHEYERVFEPLTDGFNRHALDALAPLAGIDLLDVAAGAGGAAAMAAAIGARVVAVDGSAAMVARMQARGVAARRADAGALPFPDASFDAVLSSFGVVLLPDPGAGLAEIRRVLRPGGRVCLVTWTEPEAFELAALLRRSVIEVTGAPPAPGELPAQLRFTDPEAFRALLLDAGFGPVGTAGRVASMLHAASPGVLAASLRFAPGMAATLEALGPASGAVVRHFAESLRAARGDGPVALRAQAHLVVGVRP